MKHITESSLSHQRLGWLERLFPSSQSVNGTSQGLTHTPHDKNSRPSKPAREGGFTLVEVLVSIGIFAVGLTSVLPVFVNAQLTLHESELRIKASYLMNQFHERIVTMPYEQIGSEDLLLQRNGLEVYGETLMRYKADEFLTTRNYLESMGPVQKRILDAYLFDIYAHVYYNWDTNPYMKYVYLKVSWIPYQRRWRTTPDSAGDKVNVRSLERVIPKLSVVQESDQTLIPN